MAKAPRTFVLGTAGHIDHGKTSLVRALTGTDTDRLPEEKRRGITIELGFAPWHITSDLHASIVDVPGHENFVRTMVAGAGGIDAVILVVSAEDGVMPQTREHINVCRLLGVRHGIVALTKIDRLEGDAEAIDLAADDVRESLVGTVFEEAPILGCSAISGEGIDALKSAVKKLVTGLPRRDAKGAPIMPLDRVFTMKGHGTVVTGTLLQGTFDIDKQPNLRLVPTGDDRAPRTVRARQAQVRGGEESRIGPGSRVAVNLAGVEVAELSRGDVLTRGPLVEPGTVFHAAMQHLPGRTPPWTHGTTVQVCAGTAFAVGRLDPLWLAPSPDHPEEGDADDVAIGVGREGLVRVRLETPMPLWRDMSVVVRDFSGPPPATASEDQGRTIGGGVVVDPDPPSGRGQRKRWVAVGRTLTQPDPDRRLVALVHDAHTSGVDTTSLLRRSGVQDAASRLSNLADAKKPELIALPGERWGHIEHLRPLVDQVVTSVDHYHRDHPDQPGASRATVEAMLGSRVAADIAGWAVEQALERGTLQTVDDAGTVGRPGKGVQATGELPEHMQRVMDVYEHHGITAPTVKEVTAECGLDPRKTLEILGVLQRTGRLVKVTADISMATGHHDKLVDEVRAHLSEHGTIDVQALKGMTGLTRKYAVPFLEHLDQLQVTRREGDRRLPGPKA